MHLLLLALEKKINTNLPSNTVILHKSFCTLRSRFTQMKNNEKITTKYNKMLKLIRTRANLSPETVKMGEVIGRMNLTTFEFSWKIEEKYEWEIKFWNGIKRITYGRWNNICRRNIPTVNNEGTMSSIQPTFASNSVRKFIIFYTVVS